MTEHRTASRRLIPGEQPCSEGWQFAVFLRTRTRVKRVLMWMHGHLWVPHFVMAAAFRALRLKEL